MEEIVLKEDFGKAKEIYDKIIKEVGKSGNIPPILFALCLIYVRLLKVGMPRMEPQNFCPHYLNEGK